MTRETILFNFYSAERRNGASALEANEAMHFFAKRFDAQERRRQEEQAAFARDLEIIRQTMERA